MHVRGYVDYLYVATRNPFWFLSVSSSTVSSSTVYNFSTILHQNTEKRAGQN